jgi:hypothetical protein
MVSALRCEIRWNDSLVSARWRYVFSASGNKSPLACPFCVSGSCRVSTSAGAMVPSRGAASASSPTSSLRHHAQNGRHAHHKTPSFGVDLLEPTRPEHQAPSFPPRTPKNSHGRQSRGCDLTGRHTLSSPCGPSVPSNTRFGDPDKCRRTVWLMNFPIN